MQRREFIGALAASAAGAVPALQAQTNPSPSEAAPHPKGLRITLLGTGTPAPSLERQGSGYLFEVDGDLIVMDHGPGAHHRLLESGHRAVEVTHAFFTHLHYDHCMDYGRLVLQRWDQGADKIAELEVYGPPPIKRMTELLFGEEGVYGPDILARIEHQSSIDVFQARGGEGRRRRPTPQVMEIRAGDVVERRSWKVTAGHASHVQPYLECLAFRLDTDYGSVCYSGDSGANEEMIELAKGCDVLIHMNHCFSGTAPSEAYRDAVGHHKANAQTAKRAGVKTLVLTHCLAQIDQPRIREQIVHEIQQEFPGRVVWGEDLMKLTLDAPDISGIEGY